MGFSGFARGRCNGTLAERILAATGADPGREAPRRVYRGLWDGLAENRAQRP